MGELFIQVMRETGIADFFVAEGKVEGKAEGRAEGRAEGEARGKIEGKAEGEARGEIKGWLKARFKQIPPEIVNRLNEIHDVVVLQSLAVQAENCKTLEEFKKAL